MYEVRYIATFLQGISQKDAETVLGATKAFENMARGQVEGLEKHFEPLGRIICREIVKQKKRLGGDFAVAQAVISRDEIRLLSFEEFQAF